LFSYERGWQRLFDKKVIRPDPGFDNEYYLGSLKNVEWLIVRHGDLDSTVINGKTIYSAKAMYFDTIGPGKVVSSGVGVIDPPEHLRIRYRVEP
jgi:hypothetical protein